MRAPNRGLRGTRLALGRRLFLHAVGSSIWHPV